MKTFRKLFAIFCAAFIIVTLVSMAGLIKLSPIFLVYLFLFIVAISLAIDIMVKRMER